MPDVHIEDALDQPEEESVPVLVLRDFVYSILVLHALCPSPGKRSMYNTS